MPTYYGFSTVNPSSQRSFRLTDNDLIIQDLLNSLNTRQGSRLMLPQEGCVIWELLYEPLTAALKQEITDNLIYIVGRDPRLNLLSVNLSDLTDQNTIVAELQVTFVATNQVDNLRIQFDLQGGVATV
jgi:phage baseplate assembly protein W